MKLLAKNDYVVLSTYDGIDDCEVVELSIVTNDEGERCIALGDGLTEDDFILTFQAWEVLLLRVGEILRNPENFILEHPKKHQIP